MTEWQAGPLDALAARFEEAAIPLPEWTHATHLSVGAWHVARFGTEEALGRLRVGIRRLNDAHGTPNSETRGYHETITRAYVTLLDGFLATCPLEMTLDEKVAALVCGPDGARDALLAFYSRDRLMSPFARAHWVEPDLGPILPCGGSSQPTR